MKKQITKRALIERIRRKLSKESKVLHKHGDGYIVIDIKANEITEEIIDLEKYARDFAFLKLFEEVKQK